MKTITKAELEVEVLECYRILIEYTRFSGTREGMDMRRADGEANFLEDHKFAVLQLYRESLMEGYAKKGIKIVD